MIIISKEIEFDAGHRVPLHTSKCANPHGHRYRVKAYIAGDLITSGPETGMVKDFGNVKEILTLRVHDVFDHGFIIYDDDAVMLNTFNVLRIDGEWICMFNFWKVIVVPFVPTAECLAQSIFDDLKENGLPNLVGIEVWETPTSMAMIKKGM